MSTAAAIQLWRHVFGGQRGYLCVFSGHRAGPDRLGGARTKYFEFPARVEDAASHAAQESAAGREAYFCAHLLTSRRRKKENAGPAAALWGELDGVEIPNGSLRPTALIESSPGRFHVYYRLTDAVPPEVAEGLNKRLAREIGADPSGFDLTQLLRVPGTVNHKYPERAIVKVLELDGGRSYSPAELDGVLPEVEEPSSPDNRNDYVDEPPVRLDESGYRVWRGEDTKLRDGELDRSGSLVKIGRVLYDAGANRGVIERALAGRDRALGWDKYSGRQDATKRYSEIVDELERSGRTARVRIGFGKDAGGQEFGLTDLGNSGRLIARHGHDLRYCYSWSRWLAWDGLRWALDDSGEVVRRAKATVKEIYREAADAPDDVARKALAGHAVRSEAENRIQAMISLAKSEVPISPDDLDADPWLLNAPNGTADLRSGELREHRRGDLLTKIAGAEYRQGAPAPTWAAFLGRVLPAEELREFVRRASGYSATGDTSEQCMFINIGRGANGKTTFQEALAAALGDYAMRTPTETLLAKRAGGIPNDVARLKGARFVAASETEEGRRLAESLVKDLTGGDAISARFMRAEWFDFKPTHKLWLSTNHKPEIRGTDNAIWRRIRLIPWAVAIPPAQQDRKLAEKLKAELPGILAWAVEGCLEWRRGGLRPPEEVRRATGAYRAEMDVLGAFLQECCILDADSNVAAKDLYAVYKLWCEENGERPETQRRFGARLTERGGFERYRGGKSGGHRWRGAKLLTLWESAICRGSDPTEAKLHINAGGNTPRGENREKESEGSEGSVKVPTEDEERRVQRLRHEGMAERFARRSVSGEG